MPEAGRRVLLDFRFAVPAVLLFSYVLWFRTHGISDSFWLFADQIRDWQVALRSFGDLPLVGPPSLAGGNTAGPSYYWVLWIAAHTIGPFVDYLPHAGGIGISILQSAADVVLFLGLARRLGSRVLALAIVLMVATSGHDATISSTIWNPPVAIALMKIALGVAMIAGVASAPSLMAVTAISWLAVQAHTTPLPVTLALLGYAAVAGAPRDGWALAVARRIAAIAVVVGVLQIPWLVHRLTVAAAPAATPMGDSIAAVLRDPIGAPRPLDSVQALARAAHFNTGLPVPQPVFAGLALAGALALLLRVKDPLLGVVAAGPLVCAVVLFSVWQGPLNENYWYLALAPSVALCVLGWIAVVPGRWRTALGALALVLLLGVQPQQAQIAWHSLRTPVYGTLVRGSRAAMASGHRVREVTAGFAIPPGTDVIYLYSLLGGTLDRSAPDRVVIDENGAIRFEPMQ